MINWDLVCESIKRAAGRTVRLDRRQVGSGGCINSAVVVAGDERRYFVKYNDASCLDMFEAEIAGLEELKCAKAVRVPDPLCCGISNDCAFLVLEYLELGAGNTHSGERLGRQLAALHRHSAALFGWRCDNTIGSTPQINSQTNSWTEFWRNHRLGYQLTLARQNGYGGAVNQKGEHLLIDLDWFFSTYNPRPALVHGDLWRGNCSALPNGEPVLYDPAVYYGDRETDIAMTELFGGFDAGFYAAYRDDYPLDEGYETRKNLYNLYHVLNHLNLFGTGYRGQAVRLLDVLIGELK